MKLFLLSQDIVRGYDTYDSVVVSAKSEKDARSIHPSNSVTHVKNGVWMGTYSGGPNRGNEYVYGNSRTWPGSSDIDKISVKYLGETNIERGVICASFKAG